MILQTPDVNTLIGIGIMVGVALLLAILTKVPLVKGFICYCLVVAPFLYQASILPFWVIVLLIIAVLMLIVMTLLKRRTAL